MTTPRTCPLTPTWSPFGPTWLPIPTTAASNPSPCGPSWAGPGAEMELDTGTETVLAEIVDGVGLVTLNRPERRNALHPEMYRAVPITVERFIRHPDVGCILI